MTAFSNRSELEEYIRMTTEPRTPEEWTLAITNPHSPVYKLAMVDMAECVLEDLLLTKFVERLSEITSRQERLEEQALIDQAFYEERKEERARLQEATEYKQPDEVNASLEEQKAGLEVDIAGMVEMQAALEKSLLETSIRLNVIQTQWKHTQRVQAQALARSYLSELALDLSPEVLASRQTAVEKAMQLTSPVRILEVHPMLLNRMSQPEASVHTLAEDLMGRFNVARELNVLTSALFDNADEGFNPKALLNALKANKHRPSVPRCTPVDKNSICDAITGVCRKRQDEQALHQVAEQLAVRRRDLARVQEALESQQLRPARASMGG